MTPRRHRNRVGVLCISGLLVVGCVGQGRNARLSRTLLQPPATATGTARQQSSAADLSSWARVDGLRPGVTLRVRIEDGTEIRGDFRDADVDRIRLLDRAGNEISVVKSSVREVRSERDDGNWNGILIGAGAGVGGSLVLLEGVQSTTSTDLLGTGWAAVPFVLGVVGGLVGWFIDEDHKGTDLLYRAR